MPLYIGTASASSDHKESPINEAIIRLAATIARKRSEGEIPESPSLDVSFLLPGKFDKPSFKGMQMGGFTRENDTLFFECAVPEDVVDSRYVDIYLTVVMMDVIENAADYFAEVAVEFDKALWSKKLNAITATIN